MLSTASRLVALAGAAVGASVAAVFATTQDVEGCQVPEGSLLDYSSLTQEVWYQDCFRTRVSIQDLRSVGRTRTTDAFLQAFFRYKFSACFMLSVLALAGADLAWAVQLRPTLCVRSLAYIGTGRYCTIKDSKATNYISML